jgi:hypothetical protein
MLALAANPPGTMKIQTDAYLVQFDAADATVRMTGSLRLMGMESYDPVNKLLQEALDASPTRFTLDLRDLEYLNSSGINCISRFVIKAREKPGIALTVLGSARVTWQGKSLANLQRFMPSLKLVVS